MIALGSRRARCPSCGVRRHVVDFDTGRQACAECLIAESSAAWLAAHRSDGAAPVGWLGKAGVAASKPPTVLDLRTSGVASEVPSR